MTKPDQPGQEPAAADPSAAGPSVPDPSASGPHIPPVGVVGLGDIGGGVAGALLAAGVDLTVCDVRAEATGPFAGEARVAATPAGLAAYAGVVVVAVVNDEQVRSVVDGPDGLLAGFAATGGAGDGGDGAGPSIVVVSTITTATVRELAAKAAAAGASVVDCGVSGGPGAAADGQLVCMVGGAPEAVDRVRPVLDVIGSEVLHMGPLGAGLSAKLARNVVQYGSWLAAYEAQVLAEAAGIDLAQLATAIRSSDRRIGGAATLMFRPTVAPLRPDVPTDAGLIGPMRAAAALAHKDLRAALGLADTLGVPMPLAHLTDTFTDAIFGVGQTPSSVTAGVGQTPSGETAGVRR
ncbi:MAG TPA: NAD(P)-binding domain-containing protein [Acidimicrobiales bacterium]|nr:NAD(P)-binding domain-containing protein [Acidimicrobiales bacterium]